MTHIDNLLAAIYPEIPFQSKTSAEQFLSRYPDFSDRIAFVSALYFGRSHIHENQINEDYAKYIASGEMNRFWEEGSVPDSDIALKLYEKNTNLKTYYDAFIRCTTASNYDRSKY